MCKIEVYRVCLVIIYLKMRKIVIIYFYCILKVCKKTLNIPLNIYPHNTVHNNLRYIARLYTLLYILINAIKN